MPSNTKTGANIKNKAAISWEELKKHNTNESCWIVYFDKVYDISEWGKSHPGGDMIYLGGGTDASILVNSYHPAGINPKILEKYYIGDIEQDPNYKSFYEDLENDPFYATLKERVVQHFKSKNMSYKGESNIQMYLKTLFILVGYVISLYFMAVQGSFIAAAFFGVFSAEIGMSVMHDGSHGAFSKIKLLNFLTCWLMDVIGASSYVWEIQHVAGHHLHTNCKKENSKNIESDPDVFTSYPFVRMHPSSERRWYHAYQHFYTPILFSLFTFIKVLYTDFSNFYDSYILHLSMKPRLHQTAQWVRIFAMKFLSVGYTIVFPMYYQGIWKGFWLYFVFHIMVGTILACMFQVTHLSEGCTMPSEDKELKLTQIQREHCEKLRKKHGVKTIKKCNPKSWAVLQCKTSCNWALDSWFWTQFSGGLNHQIEHHLFPGICHIHYRDIQQIVEKTCAEFDVPYITHKNFYDAFAGLLNYLKQLGNPPTIKKQ